MVCGGRAKGPTRRKAMRQVSVRKATAVAALSVAIGAALSGGAVYMLNRDKVAMHIPEPRELAAACAIVTAVHRNNPRLPVMLHPEIFGPEKQARDYRFFYMIRGSKQGEG